MMKVRFIKLCLWTFHKTKRLSRPVTYNPGDISDIEDIEAKEMLRAGYVEVHTESDESDVEKYGDGSSHVNKSEDSENSEIIIWSDEELKKLYEKVPRLEIQNIGKNHTPPIPLVVTMKTSAMIDKLVKETKDHDISFLESIK